MKAPRVDAPLTKLSLNFVDYPNLERDVFPTMGVSLTMRVYPKSAAVDAEQWLGWEHHGDGDLDVYVNQSDPTTGYMEVYRGVETINVGDWIVTHVNGRRTPYTPAAFKRIFAELPAEKKEDA
jgi:hypothetical protein